MASDVVNAGLLGAFGLDGAKNDRKREIGFLKDVAGPASSHQS
jgi:hypothetical protein